MLVIEIPTLNEVSSKNNRRDVEEITEAVECSWLAQWNRDNWAKLRYRLTLTPIFSLFSTLIHDIPISSIKIKTEYVIMLEEV